MRKEWYSSTELAGLPGLPKTDRAIRIRAEKQQWQSRAKTQGKGLEYHIGCLPNETRQHLNEESQLPTPTELVVADINASLEREAQAIAQKKRRIAEEQLAELAALEEEKRNLVHAKLSIIAASTAFISAFKNQRKQVVALEMFCQKYKEQAGVLNIPAWVYALIESVTAVSLRRWKSKLEQKGPLALAGKISLKSVSKIEAAAGLPEFILALITARPHMITKSKEVANLIDVKRKQSFPHWPSVSASSVQRHLKQLQQTKRTELAYATNPREYNNSHRALFGKMYPWVSRPNQVWELDSTPTDVQLNVEGKARRYSLIGAIDVYTRRLMLVMMPTSTSEGICLLLRKCILTWGIPEPESVIRTDNGSDYVSQRTTGLMALLSLNQSKATAFSGWEKPFIERAFKTISHGLMEKMPGYIGHNVADKKRLQEMRSFAESIGAKRKERDQELLELSLTPAELQRILDDYIEFDYNHREHSGLNGKTPFQVYAESGYRASVPENPHSLDLLLNFIGIATVVRGRVKANSLEYTAPELMEPQWDRQQVRVFLDPSNVGRATLYPLDSMESCVEAVNIDLVGKDIDPAEFRQRRKDATRALRNFKKSAEQLQKQYGIDELAAVELAQKKLANQNITAFNQPQINTGNSALVALSKSATSIMNSDKPAEYTEAELAAIETRRAEIERRREAAERQNASLAEQHSKVLRSEHEQAEWLTRESIKRDLTTKESSWLISFRNSHVMTRRRLDKILEEGKRANG